MRCRAHSGQGFGVVNGARGTVADSHLLNSYEDTHMV